MAKAILGCSKRPPERKNSVAFARNVCLCIWHKPLVGAPVEQKIQINVRSLAMYFSVFSSTVTSNTSCAPSQRDSATLPPALLGGASLGLLFSVYW